jgi:Ca2+-binding EF-hand superfamily protein
MIKRLKTATMIAALSITGFGVLPAAAQSPFPSSAQEFSSHFWSERMMRVMDTNKDGMVSRQEFLGYMGTQFDMMDTGKKGMLTSQQFMDKKMMARTFTFPSSPSESGQNR